MSASFTFIIFFLHKEKSGNSLSSHSQGIRVGSFDLDQSSTAGVTQFLLTQSFEAWGWH